MGRRRAILASLALGFAWVMAGGCDDEPVTDALPERWEIQISAEAPYGVSLAGDDLVRYAAAMGLDTQRVEATGRLRCRHGVGIIALLGDGLGEVALDTPEPTDQTFRYRESRCGSGALVELSGGGELGRQYAAYEWLHAHGVRFFHPEEEHVPATLGFSEPPLDREHTPSFPARSVSLHLTHPLELGDPFRLGDSRYFDEARRYIDWQLKNLATHGHAGVGDGDLAEHGLRRGFPRSAGISLHNTQQGGRPVVDPDDPRPVEDQIAEAIERVMGGDPARTPVHFSFQFNPSEFTEIPDTDAVREITFVGDYMAEHYPDTVVMTINHGTHGEPTPTYGVRFFDLSEFAPDNVGVSVHTLMFYDLERPAPVYGNESFAFLFDFMERNYRTRRLWYFPESAWWLTFDNAVPLYLPITIEARDRDIHKIAFMLDGKLEGHRVFGSGHEWGYWQNEYCAFRMAADLEYRWQDCLADITSPMGEAAERTRDLLEEVIAHQETVFFDRDILAYLVGTDPETEVAASIGVVFHPLPPAPQEILRWDMEQVDAFTRDIRPRLEEMDAAYARFTIQLNAVADMVPRDAANLFGEIRDGVEVTGLRARHAWQLYGALVELRRSQLALTGTDAAEALLADAMETTSEALAVIARREMGYRYAPLSRSIAGGPDGTEDDNWTIYGYRYLGRTHHGYYYTRPDALAMEAFAGAADAVSIEDALLGPGEALVVQVVDAALADVRVVYGDGMEETGGPRFEHLYPGPDIYDVAITADRGGEPLAVDAQVAALLEESHTGFTGTVLMPMGASIIEGVMPALVFGPVDDARAAIGFATDESHRVDHRLWAEVARTAGAAELQTSPATITVPVVNRMTGSVMTTLRVEEAVLFLADATGPVDLAGQLPTDDIVAAVVAIGGFDEVGARRIVASTLGYTPDELPARVPFQVRYEVE